MPRGWFTFQRYYDDDGGAPQGGGDGGKVKTSDVLAQYGQTAEAALRMAERMADLQNDNWTYRRKIERMTAERDELKAKVAPDGARVLTADEAQAYDAYVALGAPDALKSTLDASQGATAELAALRRAERLRAAADAAGYKPSVLTQLAGDLDIQTKATKEGKPLAVVVEGEKETALADYAKAHWADFLPALTPGQREVYDINAGARNSGGKAPIMTDEDREKARRVYKHTF